ncbi:hypothetical protein HNV11_04375 [Spirosoma taeanense]|uniref:T9SS type A sorting domain-containing protein n=1 Tax=Spirosoma taeanense TaxID=2735870 RepID=A0A6M5Y4F7_9BACT|nr:hypothetical protein [Spirosoma taeanense]QJW88665.1 hypothetical protein HNV11_04375 [Spirosoma taeanense]
MGKTLLLVALLWFCAVATGRAQTSANLFSHRVNYVPEDKEGATSAARLPEEVYAGESTTAPAPKLSEGRYRLWWYSPDRGQVAVQLSDLNGRMLVEQNHAVRAGTNTLELKLGAFPIGSTYILHARQGAQGRTFKVQIEPQDR